MRVLIVHNYYRSAAPSGENTVVEAERELLGAHGHETAVYSRSNDEFSDAPVRIALEAILFSAWNPWSAQGLKRQAMQFQPDVIHVHNTFPLLTASVASAAHHCGAAVVATLHNYRLECANGILLRAGSPCLDCLESRSVAPAVRHSCYRDSRLATLPAAAAIAWHRHRQTWAGAVDAFIVMTEFQRGILAGAGYPSPKLHVKPHFCAAPDSLPGWNSRAPRALFIGRLSEEKGCEVLLRAWRQLGETAPELEIIGEGPLRDRLERMAAELGVGARLHFSGQLPHEEVLKRLGQARLLVVPSLCFETFGLPVIEAYAAGVPVIGSRLGALQSVVADGEAGALFEAGNASELAATVHRLWQDPERLARQSQAARHLHQRKYSAAANLDKLQFIYDKALAERRSNPVRNAGAR